MGFMARQLFKMEQKNNERILGILRNTLHQTVKAELSVAACHEEVTKHSSILLTFPDGSIVNQYRCRMVWFMSAPGQPTLPLRALDATNADQSAWGIAKVANEMAQDLHNEADSARAMEQPSGGQGQASENDRPLDFNECIQCGEPTPGRKYCEMCF